MATQQLRLSEVKTIREFCDDLFSQPDWREVITEWRDGSDNFEVDGVRFISDDVIDETLAEEIGNDDYVLGCFNAWFLADVLEIDQDAIEAMQKAEAFEAVGKLIKSMGKLEELAEAYARADGYGHHFNGYDFSEKEIRISGTLFHVFDNR